MLVDNPRVEFDDVPGYEQRAEGYENRGGVAKKGVGVFGVAPT